jgi:predicted Zn-dependent peptidase
MIAALALAFTLANGMRVYVQPAPTREVVVLASVALSPAFDPPHKEGTGAVAIAALHAHSDAVYEYGDRFGAHVRPNGLTRALTALAAHARDAAVPADTFSALVDEETQAAAERDADIGVRTQRAFDRAIYSSSDPLLRYESRQSIAAVTPADVAAYVRTYFVPQNMTLIICGNVDAAAVRGIVQRTFGRWPRARVTPVVALPKPPQTIRTVTVIGGTDTLDHIRIGQRTLGRLNHDFYALNLINAVISARLAQTLPESATATSSLLTTRDRGVLALNFAAAPADLNIDRDRAKAAADRVLRERIPAAEWNAARARLLASPSITDPTQPGQIARLTNIALNDLPVTYFQRLGSYYAVSPADGFRAAHRYLRAGTFAEVIVTSAAPQNAAPPPP